MKNAEVEFALQHADLSLYAYLGHVRLVNLCPTCLQQQNSWIT